MMSRRGGVLVITIWLSCCALASEQAPLANLPSLNLGEFPPEVRNQVQQVYTAAWQQPRDSEAVGKLGMLLDVYARSDQAMVCYERAQQLDPRAFRWPYYLALLLAKQGKHTEAARAFQGALRLNPDYLPARLMLAESLFKAGNLDASNDLYSEIVKGSPGVAEAYFGLGRILASRGDPAAARESFLKACDLFPDYGAVHYALAQVDRRLGKAEEAEQELASYARNKSVVPPANDSLGDQLQNLDRRAAVHLERGVQLEQVGKLNEAIAETEEALRLDPQLVQGHINLLILYGRTGDKEKAEEHYRAAVKLNPTQFPGVYYNYSILLINEGKFEEAEKALRKALEIAPAYADAHNNLSYLLEREGRLPEAAIEYRKAIEANPNSRKAHFNLGRVLVNQQQYQEGIGQLLQTLTPVDNDTPAYLFALGAAYGRAGDPAKALHYLEQAKGLAVERGQTGLVPEIDKALESVKAVKEYRSPVVP